MLFASLARECSLEFVTDVLVLPQRQTALVAKQVATLDLLAPGRIRLGIGIGWNAVEYEGLGVEFADRAARIEEQIELLRRFWTEPSVHAPTAPAISIDAAGIAPLPTRTDPDLARHHDPSPAVARVGRLADGWMPDARCAARARASRTAWRDRCWPPQPMPAATPMRSASRVTSASAAGVGRPRRLLAVARWRDVGADAVAVNPLRDDAVWPDGHLDLLLRAAESLTG